MGSITNQEAAPEQLAAERPVFAYVGDVCQLRFPDGGIRVVELVHHTTPRAESLMLHDGTIIHFKSIAEGNRKRRRAAAKAYLKAAHERRKRDARARATDQGGPGGGVAPGDESGGG